MKRFFCICYFLVSAAFAGNKAVVIVDMQYGFYRRGDALQTRELIQLVGKQKQLLSYAKSEKLPIVFFEYHGYEETDSALTNALWGYGYKKITKYDDNAFSGKSRIEANNFLNSLEVDTLIIAGINASGCVKRTAVGALKDGYKVLTAADIIADMYRYPPVYPQSDWFLESELFQGYNSLELLLLSL